jgi:hypothetical protein
MDDLRLPDDCWTSTQGELEVGDVLAGVPFITLRRLADIIREEEIGTGWMAPVRMAYGVVLKVVEGQGIVGEVATAESTTDDMNFDGLLELGNEVRDWVTLPRLSDDSGGSGWWESAFVTLFTPISYPVELLKQLRVRSMTPEARSLLAQRVARCFEA